MTKQYMMYLQIARLVAKRARLVRLMKIYPKDDRLIAEYNRISNHIKFHQTFEEDYFDENSLKYHRQS